MNATLHRGCSALCLLAGLVLSLLSPARSEACSVTSEFLPPSNYELVSLAANIVLARATSTSANGVAFEIIDVLRGSQLHPKDVIELEGDVSHYAGASAPGDFSSARPGAASGGCVAYDYRLGGQFLLMLKGSPGKWSTLRTPFARVNEEVTGPGDPWLAAVRHYVRISALPDPAKERAALEALRVTAEKNPSPSHPAALVADIERHARTPSQYKTFAELKAMYDTATSDRAKSRALVAIALRADPAASSFMAQILKQAEADPPRSSPLLLPLSRYYEKVPDSKGIEALAELYSKLGSGMKQERWPLMWTLVGRAGAEHRQVMAKALAGADDEEAGRLAAWFARHPSQDAEAHLTKLVNGEYEKKTEITFALAAMGAKAPLAWALRVVATPSPPQRTSNTRTFNIGDKPDRRWVAPYVIARSPLPEADRAAAAIIRARREDFISLLMGYEEALHPNATRRLAEIAALPDLNDIERGWLDRSRRGKP